MKFFDKTDKKMVSIESEVHNINNINELIYFEKLENFKTSKLIKAPESVIRLKEFHFLFFIGKTIIVEMVNIDSLDEILLNPMVRYIALPNEIDITKLIDKETVVKNQKEIENIICHIDLEKINNYNKLKLKDLLKPVWSHFVAYHIFNVNQKDFVKMYENIAESLIGRIRLCHPVNDKSTKFSKSRDIKPNPKLYHYFAANTRQPLHSDYSYYDYDDSPDWLMLYCMYPSEYGGETQLLSNKTLVKILRKYNPSLLSKIHTDITYEYTGIDGDKIHKKPLFDGKFINWNYWQIKKELNSHETMKTREELFKFLEKIIVDGKIYDFSKEWRTGDCIIFNDHLTLHGRSAFLGDRWLKDHAVFAK